MDKIIAKAHVLIEAMPYIQEFQGSLVVIKFGGSAMENEQHLKDVLADICFLSSVGIRPIVVHGGGKAISRGMAAEGIASRFVHGLRVTCEKTIAVVEKVLKGEVNPRLVATLQQMGARAEALHGDEVFRVARVTGVDPDSGEAFDWGFVGEPDEVKCDKLRELIRDGVVPVITPLGIGEDGKLHNINADTAAAAVAKALPARKLVYLSDVPGVLRDPTDEDSIISHVNAEGAEKLIADGIITTGMVPKIKSSLAALHAGVRKVHMVDGRMPHALLLEIFTDRGVGTEIIEQEP